MRGFKRRMEPLRVLSDSGTESMGALDLLEKFECIINKDKRLAKISVSLVQEFSRTTPSSFVLRSREGKNNPRMGANKLCFMLLPGLRLSDTKTRKTRMPSMEEDNEAVRTSDVLDLLDLYLGDTSYFESEKVELLMLSDGSEAQRLRRSTKITRVTQPAEPFIV